MAINTRGGVIERVLDKKNLGWRIDYNMVSQSLEKYILDARILSDVVHSDHCPISLKIKS